MESIASSAVTYIRLFLSVGPPFGFERHLHEGMSDLVPQLAFDLFSTVANLLHGAFHRLLRLARLFRLVTDFILLSGRHPGAILLATP